VGAIPDRESGSTGNPSDPDRLDTEPRTGSLLDSTPLEREERRRRLEAVLDAKLEALADSLIAKALPEGRVCYRC
jgi:hypothetical protein